jgi:HK97 family phage portal protein
MKIPFTKKELRLFSLTDMDKAMDQMINGRQSATGLSVTPNSANSLVAYFAGKRLIAETVGQLPLIEYKRLDPRGKERATNRILYSLLHDAPNPEMDAMSFKESRTENAVGWGNAFAEIERDDQGVPVALWPLQVDKMQVGRDQYTKQLIYAYRLPNGQTVILPAYRVWHLKGFSPDGIIGYDTVYLMREAIGMGLALEEYGSRFFGNNAAPGGVLEHPNKLSKESQDNLRKSWNEMHQGLTNAHRLAILEEGMKFHSTSIPNDNAQFLESQKFTVVQMARMLNLPPHMLADLDRATFSNIEQQYTGFVVYSMMPWFRRWEGTCNFKLLTPFERNVFFFEFLVDALLRGDSASRAAFYKELFYLGALSPNDIREKENMNPIPDEGADQYWVQANMRPMELAVKEPPAPAPAALPAPQPDKTEDVARSIVQRDKENIMRALKRGENLESWLPDYYRDFEPYVIKQLSHNGHKE